MPVNPMMPALLPDKAAIEVLQYSTADALFRMADSLYATISPVFNSLVFTLLDDIITIRIIYFQVKLLCKLSGMCGKDEIVAYSYNFIFTTHSTQFAQ